ncbi:hypothetical protein D3C83_172220 [compost metagenome]
MAAGPPIEIATSPPVDSVVESDSAPDSEIPAPESDSDSDSDSDSEDEPEPESEPESEPPKDQ